MLCSPHLLHRDSLGGIRDKTPNLLYELQPFRPNRVQPPVLFLKRRIIKGFVDELSPIPSFARQYPGNEDPAKTVCRIQEGADFPLGLEGRIKGPLKEKQ